MNNFLEKIKSFQVILSCIIITSGILFASALFAFKMPQSDSITVTGSASRVVKSNNAKLSFSIQENAPTQKQALNIIKSKNPKVVEYLEKKGIQKNNIEIKAIDGYYEYKRTPNGYMTNEIEEYRANQNIIITSNDVEKIKEISTDIQNLINDGINLNIYQPEYFYSDLASIKIDLLKEASQDAKNRAVSMLQPTGTKVGKVKSVRMGVFQITPADSTSVSDMGVNDTSTIDKKVTAVANIVFKVK